MKTTDQLKLLLIFWDVFTVLGTGALAILMYLNIDAIRRLLEML